MCLAIPGQIVEVDDGGEFAKVEVSGVRRRINAALLDDVAPGDWVLIHVGFAMSRISAEEAAEQMDLLRMLGEQAEAMAEVEGYGSAGDEPEAEIEELAPERREAS